jgi:hypothetical protein
MEPALAALAMVPLPRTRPQVRMAVQAVQAGRMGAESRVVIQGRVELPDRRASTGIQTLESRTKGCGSIFALDAQARLGRRANREI